MMSPGRESRPGSASGAALSKINNGRVVDDSTLSGLADWTQELRDLIPSDTGCLTWRRVLDDGRLLVVSARVVPADGDHDPAVLADRLGDVEHMQRRAIQDAVTQAQSATWQRRADLLDWCRPRAGDFNGRATPAELALRDRRLAEDAQACREHAVVLTGGWSV